MLQKVHAATSPKFTMRPHLKDKVMANGTTVSWSKVSGGPGPGSSSPHVSRRGGGYLGDAPTHKIGTGVKIPHPASNFSPVSRQNAWNSLNEAALIVFDARVAVVRARLHTHPQIVISMDQPDEERAQASPLVVRRGHAVPQP